MWGGQLATGKCQMDKASLAPTPCPGQMAGHIGHVLPWHEILIPPLNLSSPLGFCIQLALAAFQFLSLVYLFCILGKCVCFWEAKCRVDKFLWAFIYLFWGHCFDFIMFAVSRWVEKRLGNLYFFALWPKCNIYIICESGICICIKKAYINQAKTYANICFLTFVDPCSVLFLFIFLLMMTRIEWQLFLVSYCWWVNCVKRR